ncbi:hypothetical protein HO133_002673 [Letharia lupina]|uniref:Heterokaryon incompatibility domain-containing protein n=1 Tax=Letharia lupina TaxID=560253 RepID=A0A8H6CCM7_9LECA|nr:uncharacterized protein HO133_002673 [Letharia lupina]KAF6220992.1 hypothetical protein HO133_002673 [Letharia lupina]
MSFHVDFTGHETLKYCRLHFSTTNPKRDRNEDNYWNFLRLQIWPTEDFAHLSDAASDLDVSQARSHSSSSNFSDYDQIIDIVEDALPRSLISGGTDSGSDESAPSTKRHGGPLSRSSSADILENNGRYRPRPCSRDSDSDESISAIPEEDSTGSISSQRLAKEWLDRCQKNEDGQHVDCDSSEGTWLPTRLLDVRHASKTSVLRLGSSREVSDALPKEKRYITLSHCWGKWGSKEMPVLTSANERDRHEIGISIEKIPQTFRDAITVAQWFQVRWLWIDSLCIIQDSDADWRREASLMDRVYKQGYFNISADWNADARDGLFNPRSPMRVQPLTIELPEIGQTIQLTVDERDMFDWVNTAPLSQRAWVFQERHLARRIFHFTEREMFWECCSKAPYFASETFPNGAPRFYNKRNMLLKDSTITPLRPAIEIHELWGDLCEMYSEKKLSNPTDKLVAISGLAKEFQKLLPDDIYFSGMWWSTFPLCLRWKSRGRPIQEELLEAPSWSWASIDGEVKLNTRVFPESSSSPPSNLERHQYYRGVINIQNGPLSGELLDGKQTNELVISGFLRRITLVISGTLKMLKYWNKNKLIPMMNDKKTNLFLHDGNQQYEHEAADVESDLDTGEICETIDGYILFIGAYHGEKRAEIDGLLLEKRSTEPNTFRRKGTISVSGYAAIALRYKVKPDVSNQQEVWKSFKDALGPQSDEQGWDHGLADEMDGQSEHNNPSVRKRRGEGPLYDHCWEFDDSQLEQLTPQTVKLV